MVSSSVPTVMYLGKIVETAPNAELHDHRLHPYTEALLTTSPMPDPKTKQEVAMIKGDVPSPIHLPSGCLFHPRCPMKKAICCEEEPVLEEFGSGHWAACHFAGER